MSDANLIDNRIKDLAKSGEFEGKKLLVFGINGFASNIINAVRDANYDVEALLSNRSDVARFGFGDIEAYTPADYLVPYKANVFIIIYSRYHLEMVEQLLSLGYDESQIGDISESGCDVVRDSDELMELAIKDIETGYELYLQLHGEKKDDKKLFICANKGTGDVYLACGLLRDYLKENNITDYIITVVNNTCKKVVELFGYKDIHVLTQRESDLIFVVGSSGSGKTTLIKLLLKELTPTKGEITVDDKVYSKMKRKEIPMLRRKLGVVFQDFRLLRDRTVFENVAFAQQVIEKSMKEIRREVPAMLTMVGLADQYKQFPRELSGGEQQRVAIARAMVNQPDIILADEPTGDLDPRNSEEIMTLLDEINKKGTTVVVVTHNKDIVDYMQKRVIRLKKGKIVSDVEKGGYRNED